jgi:hypothetical protein
MGRSPTVFSAPVRRSVAAESRRGTHEDVMREEVGVDSVSVDHGRFGVKARAMPCPCKGTDCAVPANLPAAVLRSIIGEKHEDRRRGRQHEKRDNSQQDVLHPAPRRAASRWMTPGPLPRSSGLRNAKGRQNGGIDGSSKLYRVLRICWSGGSRKFMLARDNSRLALNRCRIINRDSFGGFSRRLFSESWSGSSVSPSFSLSLLWVLPNSAPNRR